jgi:lathosterol oxidase
MPTDACLIDLALSAWPRIWAADLLRYLLAAAATAGLIAALPLRWTQSRQVRQVSPAAGQRWREFRYSMGTVLIFSLNGVLIFTGARAGVLQIYTDVAAHGWIHFAGSLLALVLAHDTWFYWTHRLLHRRGLFGWTHRTHHRSVAPTPWAAYSFAPAEAVVQAVFLTLILTVLPLHPAVIFVFLTHMIVRNVVGHAGVELAPRRWLAGWWGRWLTTTLHHDMHHAYGRCNYGLYFTWWDRIGGTEHPQYRARLRRLVQAEHGVQEPGTAPATDPGPPTRPPHRLRSSTTSPAAATPASSSGKPSAGAHCSAAPPSAGASMPPRV